MRRGKKRAIHTFGEIANISIGEPSCIEIKKFQSDEKLLTIYSDKIPKRGVVWIVIAPFRRELLGQKKSEPFLIAKLMELNVKERQIIAKFKAINGEGKAEIVLDNRGRARNLKVGIEYILDLIERREFFERYERGSIPANVKDKRSEPDRLGAERMKIFSELANIEEGQKILDTATGVKGYLREFSKKGCRIVCTNISNSILKRTRDAIGKKNSDFVAYDVEKGFPFKDETFDLVICDALLEYISKPHDTVSQIFDLIKIGGSLLLLEPTRSLDKIPNFYPQDLWEVALWRPIFDPDFNEALVEKNLEKQGFKVVEKRTMKFDYSIYGDEHFSQSISSLYKIPLS